MSDPTATRHSCKAVLDNADMWKKFDTIGTEMVITKSGRRMFPYLKVSLSGLQRDELYSVSIEMILLDTHKYRYNDHWDPTECEVSDYPMRERYEHPDSPNFGSWWMDSIISFKHLKLTNNPKKGGGDLYLHSMCKYLPRVIVTHLSSGTSKYFSYPETTFIAVTVYHNQKIKELKIITNPYATAFREHHDTSGTDPPSPEGAEKGAGAKAAAVGGLGGDGERDPLPLFPEYMADAYGDEHVCWPLDLWPDENSLYHPALLTPPPLLDTFSEPYLRQASWMLREFYASHAQWTTPLCEDTEVEIEEQLSF